MNINNYSSWSPAHYTNCKNKMRHICCMVQACPRLIFHHTLICMLAIVHWDLNIVSQIKIGTLLLDILYG